MINQEDLNSGQSQPSDLWYWTMSSHQQHPLRLRDKTIYSSSSFHYVLPHSSLLLLLSSPEWFLQKLNELWCREAESCSVGWNINILKDKMWGTQLIDWLMFLLVYLSLLLFSSPEDVNWSHTSAALHPASLRSAYQTGPFMRLQICAAWSDWQQQLKHITEDNIQRLCRVASTADPLCFSGNVRKHVQLLHEARVSSGLPTAHCR